MTVSVAEGERRLPILLRRAWYGLNQAFRRRLTHLDLTPDQFTVLRNLAESGTGGMTQSQLKTRMSSDANTIASLVERMEGARLLSRETDADDRRARRLRLTPLGRRRLGAARTIAQQLQLEVLTDLPPADREAFLSTLEHVADACRQAADEAGL